MFEEVGFQRRGLLRFQAVVERASRHGDGLGETECVREIFGIGQREFLTVKVADGRVRFHNDSGLVAVDPSHKRAVNSGDQAILKLVVFSPKYQTLPSLSWANQSSVS